MPPAIIVVVVVVVAGCYIRTSRSFLFQLFFFSRSLVSFSPLARFYGFSLPDARVYSSSFMSDIDKILACLAFMHRCVMRVWVCSTYDVRTSVRVVNIRFYIVFSRGRACVYSLG